MRQNVAQEEDRLQPRLEEFLKFRAGINIAGQAQLAVDTIRAVRGKTDPGTQAKAAALFVDTPLLAAGKDFWSPDQGQVALHAVNQFVILGDVAPAKVAFQPRSRKGTAYPRATERGLDVGNRSVKAVIEPEPLAMRKKTLRPSNFFRCVEKVVEFFDEIQFDFPFESG